MKRLFNLVTSIRISPLKLFMVSAVLLQDAKAVTTSANCTDCTNTGYKWDGCTSNNSTQFIINVCGPCMDGVPAIPNKEEEDKWFQAYGCCPSNATTTGHDDCAVPPDDTGESSSSSLSTGEIAGIAVGGTALLATCCGLSFWAKKRQDRKAGGREHLLDDVVEEKEDKDNKQNHQHVQRTVITNNYYCAIS